MTKVLLTAFEPYDRWSENASWLALVQFTHDYHGLAEVTTRRYPVDLTVMSNRLRTDLHAGYDLAIHLGQAPGSARLRLEAVGLNLRSDGSEILPGAPTAYRSALPLDPMVTQILSAGVPAAVSHHAGTYLCNATLYLSQHYAASSGMSTQSLFVHMPLTPAQVAKEQTDTPSMATEMVSKAIAMILDSGIEFGSSGK